MIDFKDITPCGGNCSTCRHKENDECDGCRNNQGQCVRLWHDGCDIYKCCLRHEAYFCGLCTEFPCPWLIQKIGEWDAEGIEKLRKLADSYKEQERAGCI
jgi:hypothetical protein